MVVNRLPKSNLKIMIRILYISIKNSVLIMIIISNDKPQLNRRIRKAFNVNRPHAF